MSGRECRADPLEPRLNEAFVEYAQSRGFLIDPARVRSPQDKPAGAAGGVCARLVLRREDFVDLADAQRRAELLEETRHVCRIHVLTIGA